MTRLPPRLQRFWPIAKRAHRLLAFWSGLLGRRTRFLQGARAVPRRGTMSVDETVALEPAAARVHRAGPGEQIRRPSAQGTPPKHWVFERRRELDVPPPFCLDVAGGVVVGDHGAHLTPGGILDYETSEYFGLAGWREHPIFLRRRLPPVTDVAGTVVSLATRGGPGNYYHFLTDVLPRFGVVEQVLPDLHVDGLYVPAGSRWQRTLLEMTGLTDMPIIPAMPDSAVRAERLVVPSLTNPTEIAPASTVEWLRKRLPARSAGDTPRRIYITRGQVPNTRRLDREDEVMAQLEQRGFVRVEPAGLSPQEQIDLFAAAEVVVAPHGAALTNLLFVQPGAKVLEMFAPDYVNACYWSICEAIGGITYRYLVADGHEKYGPGDPMNSIQADVVIDPAVVVAAVDDLLAS